MNTEELKKNLEQALFSLCQLNVSGPAVITLGRAMEAVMTAKQIAEKEENANAAQTSVPGELAKRDTD